METRANYVAVGAFTMAVIMATFGFIYWVARLDESTNLVPINVRIVGVVTGLAAGSEVHFNGIKVGKVQRVVFDADDPRVVYALAEINADTPVRKDTTATLASQGLTGVSYISLKGGTPTAPSLFADTEPGKPPLMEARPSAVADILETVRDVSTKANDALGSLKGFIEENRTPVSNSVKNIETFSAALERNSAGIDEFLKSASGIGKSLAQLGDKLDGTIKGMEKIVTAVDADKVKSTVDNVEAFTADLRKSGAKVEGVLGSVDKAAKELEVFSTDLNVSLKKLDGLLGAVEADTLKQTIADIRDTASGAKQIVADTKSVTQTFTNRKQDIDAMVVSAREMVDRLNQSSKRVDGVLAKLDGFLGNDDSQSVMKDVSTTLAEFRKVATSMQGAINGISGGLTKFSNSGLSDLSALISDARRSFGRIDRVVSELERDPKRFLLGTSDVKTYEGRPRR
jgi:phospholipid/cholesterol/gamma-HCH transport system substrate-binding protein